MALYTGVLGSPRSDFIVLGAGPTHTVFTAAVSETLTASSDAVARAFVGTRAIAEGPVAASDAVTRVANHPRSISETLTAATDSVQRAYVGARAIAEGPVVASDAVARGFVGARAITETLTPATDKVSLPIVPSHFISSTQHLPLFANLFDKNMVYQGTLGLILNRPVFKATLNSGFQPITLNLSQINPNVAKGQIVQVFEQGGDGSIIYQGIVSDLPDTLDAQATHAVAIDPMVVELGTRQFNSSYTGVDVAQMVRDVAGLGAHITYTPQSIQNTGVLATYTFSQVSGTDALNTICGLAGPNYFWFVNELGVLWFAAANLALSPTYRFSQGTQFATRQLSTSIQNLCNYITVYGGTPGSQAGAPSTTLSQNVALTDGPGIGAPNVHINLQTTMSAGSPGAGGTINCAPGSLKGLTTSQQDYSCGAETFSATSDGQSVLTIVQRGTNGIATAHSVGDGIMACGAAGSNAFINVASDPGFSNLGYYYLQIDTEIICAYSTSSFVNAGTMVIVQRGAKGTTAASHASGATVTVPPSMTPQPLVAIYDGTKTSPYPKRELSPPPSFPQCFDQTTLQNIANTLGAALNRPVTQVELVCPAFGTKVRLDAPWAATAAYYEPAINPLVETYTGAGATSPTYVVTDVEYDGPSQKLILSDIPQDVMELTYQLTSQLLRAQTAAQGAVTPSSIGVIQPTMLATVGPTMPANFAGTTGIDYTAQANHSYINLTWNAALATDYVVGWEVAYQKQGDTLIYRTMAGTNAVKIPGLIPGQTYVFTLRALNNVGQYSVPTPQLQVVAASTTTAPATPTGLTARKSLRGAFLQWTGNTEADLQGYEVQASVSGGAYSMATTSPMLTTLYNYIAPANTLPGVSLQFQIRAVNWSGLRSSWSTASTATVTDGPIYDEILAGNILAFGTLTSGGIQTGSSGARFVIDSTSIRAYDGTATNYGAPSGAGVTVEISHTGAGFFSGTLAATSVLTGGIQSGTGLAVPSIPGGFTGFQLDPTNGLRFFSGGTLNAQFAANGQITIYQGAGLNVTGGTIKGAVFQGNQLNAPAWITGTSYPLLIAGSAAATDGSYIVVVGGWNSSALGQSSVYSAPVTNGTIGSWTSQTALPNAFLNAGGAPATVHAFFYSGRVYVLGDFATTGVAFYSAPFSGGTVGAWRTETTPPLSPSALCQTGTYAYAFGGSPAMCTAPITSGVVGSWSQSSNRPQNLGCLVSDGSYLYAIGGGSGSSPDLRVSSASVSGASIGAWSLQQPLPLAVGDGSTAVVLGGYIYITQGYSWLPGGNSITGRTFYSKIIGDGTLGPWVEITPSPAGGMWYAAVCADSSYLYQVGGSNSTSVPPPASVAGAYSVPPPTAVTLPAGYTGVQMDPLNGLMLFDRGSLRGSFGPAGTFRATSVVGGDLAAIEILPYTALDGNVATQNYIGIHLVAGGNTGADFFCNDGHMAWRVCGLDWGTAGTYAWAQMVSFPARYVNAPTGVSLVGPGTNFYLASDVLGGGAIFTNSLSPWGFTFGISGTTGQGQVYRAYSVTGGS